VAHGGTGATDAATARVNLGAAASGANSDITSLSGLTGSIASPTYIQFDTAAATPTAVAGRLYWDGADGAKTLSLVMADTGVVQQIGEEQYYRVKASSTITNGQVVMKTGAVGNSGALTAAPATGLLATETDHVLGLATQDISTGSFGYITYFGVVRGVNTTGGAESWVDGQVLYYNPAVTGGMTKNKPSIPNAIVIIGIVINAASNGSIFVRPVYGSVLGGTDGNVSFTSLTNGDVIVYQDGGNGYWKNATQASLSVGYATSAGSAGSATTATTATNLAAGAAGSLPYQTGAGATTFLGLGTSTYILTAGASAPTWTNPSSITVGSATSATSAGKATNLAGGAAASIPYQSAADTTAFLASAAGDAGKVLQSNGTSAPSWVTPTAYATVTDDTTTNATRYPLFANQTTGNLATEYVSSTKLQFNPSTGTLSATVFSGSAASLTSVPAGQLTGTIPSTVLGNSSLYIGTTSIALNRTSGSQTLNGVSIDGSAGSATNATNATNIAITDDTTTAADMYLAWVTASTGNLPAKVSSTKLKFNPSTGVLTVTGGTGGGTF
jgi:hypothetical protein